MEFNATSGLRGSFQWSRDLRAARMGRESSGVTSAGAVYHVPGSPSTPTHTLRPMSTDLGLLQLPLDVYEGPIQQRLSTMQIRGSRRGEQSPTSPCRHHHH